MEFTLVSPSQSLIYGIVGAVTGLTASIVMVHFIYKRFVVKDWFYWDDGLVWLGSCLALAFDALTIYAAYIGLGLQTSLVPHTENILMVEFINIALHTFAMVALKASLLLFFHRLFRANKTLRWTVRFSLVLLLIWILAFIFIHFLQCAPLSQFWAQGSNGTCITANSNIKTGLAITDAVLNITTDFLCLATPCIVLRKTQISAMKKTCIGLVYFLGCCKGIITILCLLYSTLWVTSDTALSFHFLFSSLELGIGVLCTCLPGLSPLLTLYFSSEPVFDMEGQRNKKGDYSNRVSFLHGFKKHPLEEWSVLTTVVSNDAALKPRLPSFDLGNFSQESLGYLLPVEHRSSGILVKFNVEQTVESRPETPV